MQRWYAFQVLTGRLLGQLPVQDWKVSDPVVGAGTGDFTLAVRGRERQVVNRLRQLTTPDEIGVVIHDTDDPLRYLWAGLIEEREWKKGATSVTVKVADWRSWFYTAVLRPGATHLNASGDYVRKNTEQVTVMRQLVQAALDSAGAPPIQVPSLPASGVPRDVTFRLWKNVGEALDNVAGRDQGMEWWIEAAPHANGLDVVLTFMCRSPGRGGGPGVALTSTPRGGNVWDYTWPESSAEKRNRVTALGEGDPAPYAVDRSPALASNQELLREQVSGPYTGVKIRSTLFAHARAERVARAAPIQSATLHTHTITPKLADYGPGDLARVRLRDEWLDVTTSGRILDRQLAGGPRKPTTVALVVDLNALEIPSTTTPEA